VSIVDLALAADVMAPAAARQALRGLGLKPSEDAAVALLTSELVTNNVRHAGLGPRQRIRLWAQITEQTARIEVIDGGAGVDVSVRAPGAGGGWGLRLVDALADRWGVAHDHGTRVWFELDRPRTGPRRML
jgi:anti-sigma regulatory factor (Ser/Thr protein kinase)